MHDFFSLTWLCGVRVTQKGSAEFFKKLQEKLVWLKEWRNWCLQEISRMQSEGVIKNTKAAAKVALGKMFLNDGTYRRILNCASFLEHFSKAIWRKFPERSIMPRLLTQSPLELL